MYRPPSGLLLTTLRGVSAVTTETTHKLGDMLLAAGLITQEQLQAALGRQAQSNQLLGTVLVAMGLVTQADVRNALASQLHIPSVDLSRIELIPGVLALLPNEFCRRHRVVPIACDEDLVTVAAADPTNVIAMDMVRAALPGRRVKAVAAPEIDILHAIEGQLTPVRSAQGARPLDMGELIAAVEQTRESGQAADPASLMYLPHVQAAFDSFLQYALNTKTTRIHVEPQPGGARVNMLQGDALIAWGELPVGAHTVLSAQLKAAAGLDFKDTRSAQHGVMAPAENEHGLQTTVSTLPTLTGERVTVQLLYADEESPGLGQLGIGPEALASFSEMLEARAGLVVIAGLRSAEAMRTLHAAAAALAAEGRSVISLERPIEACAPTITQVPLAPGGAETFASVMPLVRRHGPDTIVLSDATDKATLMAACDAASEHLILAGIRADSVATALRLGLDLGLDNHALAAMLLGAVGQRAVRTNCSQCTSEIMDRPELRQELLMLGEPPAGAASFRGGTGCESCGRTSFFDQVVLYEVAPPTAPLKLALQAGASAAELQRIVAGQGPPTIGSQVLAMAWSGQTAPVEALRVSHSERACASTQ